MRIQQLTSVGLLILPIFASAIDINSLPTCLAKCLDYYAKSCANDLGCICRSATGSTLINSVTCYEVTCDSSSTALIVLSALAPICNDNGSPIPPIALASGMAAETNTNLATQGILTTKGSVVSIVPVTATVVPTTSTMAVVAILQATSSPGLQTDTSTVPPTPTPSATAAPTSAAQGSSGSNGSLFGMQGGASRATTGGLWALVGVIGMMIIH